MGNPVDEEILVTMLVREEQILDDLRKLAPDRWIEVLEFIRHLLYQTPYKVDPNKYNTRTASDLLSSEIIGLWSDRTDTSDSLI